MQQASSSAAGSPERTVSPLPDTPRPLAFNVLHVHGEGRVGKTTLLREFAQICEESGIPVVALDESCREKGWRAPSGGRWRGGRHAGARMAANDYHFVTRWLVQGTVAEVSDILGDPTALRAGGRPFTWR
jgi:hypothetical protein